MGIIQTTTIKNKLTITDITYKPNNGICERIEEMLKTLPPTIFITRNPYQFTGAKNCLETLEEFPTAPAKMKTLITTATKKLETAALILDNMDLEEVLSIVKNIKNITQIITIKQLPTRMKQTPLNELPKEELKAYIQNNNTEVINRELDELGLPRKTWNKFQTYLKKIGKEKKG